MLLPAADMIVLRSGIPPVRGKRIRYDEDRELAARMAIEAGKPRPRPTEKCVGADPPLLSSEG